VAAPGLHREEHGGVSMSDSLDALPRLRGGRRPFRPNKPLPKRLVRVLPGWQVVYEGQVRDPGDELTIEGRTAAQWLARGYAEQVTPVDDAAPVKAAHKRRT
jgi:hypothetical protein